MADQGKQMVLRRKAQAARKAQEARAMSPQRALRLAFERCAAKDLGVRLSVTGVEQATTMADALAPELPEHALILLLDGAEGVPGVMVLDLQLTAALVEAQTMARVNARAAAPRGPTRTDAAIATPFVEGGLARFAELLEEDGAHVRGFRFGAMIDDGGGLALALGTCEYRMMRVGYSLGADRGGEMLLALPVPAPPAPDDTHPDKADIAPATTPLRARLMTAPARLDAVLCRMSLPLAQTRGLKPGDVLPLSAGVLRDTRLEATPGKTVARGVLGQMSGQRALRLHGLPPSNALKALGREGMTDAPDDAPSPAPWAPDTHARDPGGRIDPAEGMPDLSEFGLDAEPGAGDTVSDGAADLSFPMEKDDFPGDAG
ncbi:FliM/FliN family flagellar motor switch protein [Lutimaribacter sp. EGI FJ00015]|uniref:FliM/FliN family flagellar motor switch protein n=1 Tax=Lutimaribacter degradans TaxID=2945989 RepID=A0ACC5ZRI8_9RHOB|nr:FliM/FliN family flagellar motor switch protein [Lutimaribacter sp. EGI FJ00013]MCM2560906.1 FliM/FliN family flagellar motor switch protein [Lutimaribacter sp. EGI FJ00013]MCO0612149.1 FliM/FliN family flagellar motor switch protein [Lutimaribacter sp. EGI FJ00015]MCO0634731.1 FliM/FliN family flagellar motor switch protein [Lutimaribacter sp. EGI FJ00014]